MRDLCYGTTIKMEMLQQNAFMQDILEFHCMAGVSCARIKVKV